MKLKKVLNWTSLPSLLLFLLFVIFNTALSKGFMTLSAWTGFLQTTAPLIIMAIGQAVVIITGGIDLSVGPLLSVVNVIFATTSSFEGPVWKPILISLAVALGFGALNGFLVSKVRIPALLATFGVSFILDGLALTILPIPGGQVPEPISKFYYFQLFKVIPMSIFLIAFVFLVWFVISKTSLMVQLYAVGEDEQKAFFSNINVSKVKFFTYLFSALTAWIAGAALSGNFAAGDPRVGAAMTLNVIAGCVVGGIALKGGLGSPSGAIFGTLFLNLVLVTVLGLRIPGYYQDLVSGVIVLAGIFFAVTLSKRKSINLEAY